MLCKHAPGDAFYITYYLLDFLGKVSEIDDSNIQIHEWIKDMRAVTTPVATPRAKEPLKIPRNIPKHFNNATNSNVLSPCGW